MSPQLPTTMRALKVIKKGEAALQDVPLPRLRPDYILIRVHAVALNPTDWKHIDYLSTDGCTVGCDAAGTIVAIGDKVTKPLSVGDRVAGFAHGVNSVEPEDGSFAEYAVLKGDIVTKFPASLSFEQAASLGVGPNTVALGLFKELGLSPPSADATRPAKGSGDFVLVYGGSTATGTLAVEYAALAGYRVLSTNSPRNDGLVESRGAEKCFDYNDKDVVSQIKGYTGGKLRKVFDTISSGDSPEISAGAIGDEGGQICFILNVKEVSRKDVKISYILGYTIIGEAFEFGPAHFDPMPENFEYARDFATLTEKLLEDKKIELHPTDVRQGGLDKILEGLDDMRQGKVSGKKLVYTFA